MKAFQLVLMLLLLAVLGQASLLNWVLGRNPLDSDKNFDKLVQSVPSEVDPPVQEVVDHDQTGVAAPSSIKFELTSVDEKFIADAKKFADLQLSELDVCQHKVTNHNYSAILFDFTNMIEYCSTAHSATENRLQ